MRSLWVPLIVVAVGFCLGCGNGENGDKPADADVKDNGEAGAGNGGTQTTLTGAEAAANKIFADLKNGKVDALLAHTDVEGMYKEIAQEDGAEMTLEEYREQMRQALQRSMAHGVPPEGQYKIVGSEKQGKFTVVNIRVRESPQDEWEDVQFPFENIGGKWKLTAESFEKLGE
jgi:hypothetical protein